MITDKSLKTDLPLRARGQTLFVKNQILPNNEKMAMIFFKHIGRCDVDRQTK